ncbi:MAG: UDP-N-acetylglucosamine--N-acetylmuramyl-(pentapeptide) pyrophosphoryl-undecaprenol N-acetylglucosamine transferase [Clostridia bacterium]|nr:UDP-N-acetylglucosamine--N-acetylmuramyl-(pentapeptide) pyrophosphoryl-undecaprenol N-acetylglucosamine transferase [Clostridia bacterium]
MKTIVLTGGGTAGHVTPHFAILPNIKNHFDNVYYIGSQFGIEKDLVKNKEIEYFSIDPVKLIRSFTLKNALLPFNFIKSVNDAKIILQKLKPNVVFSKGGFVALPVVIASKQLGIPVITHESDLSLGLANKIASHFTVNVLTTFEKTASLVKNGVYVGAPVRLELFNNNKEECFKTFKFYSSLPVLLIIGGSSGAKSLNEVFYKAFDDIVKNFNVIHIVGKGNKTSHTHPHYRQVEYADMSKVYPIVDLCVSRAGSNTAFELLALKIPTLFMPLPKGNSRGDQIENAKYFEELKVASVLFMENASSENFIKKVYELFNNSSFYKQNIKKQNIVIGNNNISKILCKY